MARKFIEVCFIAFILTASGCFSVAIPTKAELDAASFGFKPLDYQEKITKLLEQSLFDPYSAVYECSGLCRGYSVPFGGMRSFRFGWLSICNINAKNRMGAYVGFKPEVIFFESGKEPEISRIPTQCIAEDIEKTVEGTLRHAPPGLK